MFNKKGTKRSLLMSALALLLCVSMLIGSTFAWFTDSVVSANNIIKSGTLEVSMMWADGKEEPASANWQDASTTKIFNYDKWEPGYTEARHIAVTNEGTLALKYQLTIVPTGEVSKLADVIDVYYIKTATQLDERADLSAYTPVGTLTQLINNEISAVDVMPNGKLAAGEGFTATLVLKMRESADNEYQNLSIGTNFSVQLLATQLTKENDSYGPDYDEDAWMDGMQVFTPEDLQTAINNGENPILQNDIELTEALVIPAAASTFSLRATPVYTVINLNGFRLTGTGFDANGKAHMVVNNGNAVIKNGTIAVTGANGGAALYNAEGASMILEDVAVIGAPQTGSGWPSYAVQNYGVMEINGAVVTSTHGALALYGDTVINDATVTMNGFGGSSHVFYIGGEGTDVIINGGTYTHKGNVDGSLAYIMTGTTMTVNGGTFSASNGGYGMATYTGSLTVNGGTFANALMDWGGPISIAGGTFATKPGDKYIAEGFKVVQTAAGYEVISSDRNYVAAGVYASTDGNTYYITNAAGYAWMDAQADNFFGNKTIKFTADIDFGGATLTSIRFWNSHPTIDGQGYTLSNFVIGYSGSKTPSGLFEGTFSVQNLNVVNADVTGDYVGVISGQMYGNITNCTVKDSVINGTYWQTGGLAGQYNQGNVIGCVVENCVINGKSAVGGLIGILNETAGVRKVEDCAVIDCQINQTGSFGASYDKYFGVAVGLINIDNSTVYFNNCELEGNTLKGVASNVLFGEVGSSTKVYVDGAKLVTDAAALQNAINAAAGDDVIRFGADIAGDVTVTQNDNVKITIDGNGHEFNGVLTVFGNGHKAGAALTIKNIDFVAANGASSCIVSPDRTLNNAYSYSSNVTVENCTFTDPDGVVDCAAVRHEDGGDTNWKIIDCVADNTMHSLIQVNNVQADGLTIEGCEVYSKNGINLNQCANVSIIDCKIDVKGYAVRYGVKGATVNGTFLIKDSTLKSANDGGDAVIVLRGTMTGSTLTLDNTTISGSPDFNGTANIVTK